MRRSRLFALGVIVAALGLTTAAPASAQTDTSKPIIVKQPKVKTLKFKGEVIHSNRLQITVRSLANERMIQTFRLSVELQEKMQPIIDQGGYQFGDRVEIHYAQGSDVAVKIKGKPSKQPK